MRRGSFSSGYAALVALVGSAVGLGNIWRFPYIVGEYGGAAFILIYIASTILISLPIFLCESIIGKVSGYGPSVALEKLAPGSRWGSAGIIAFIGCATIGSYYSVVGGWSVDYFARAVSGGLNGVSPEAATGIFSHISTSCIEPIAVHTIFLLISCFVVAKGVKSGIEIFSKATIPLLFLLIVAIAVYSLSLPGADAGVKYLTYPDFSKITPRTVSFAIGQSFYSLSLGVGMVITYSSYMRSRQSVVKTGLYTAVADTAFAIIAGFAVMPAVFAAGIAPESGPSLIFESIPFVFAKMGATVPLVSSVITAIFFLAILFAALTSEISLIEGAAANMIDKWGWSRRKTVTVLFFVMWVIGVLCSLSFGPLKDIRLMGKSIFSFLDMISSNVVMVAGAFIFCIFVGWKMDKSKVMGELRIGKRPLKVTYWIIKWVIPVMILLIFISNFLF